MYIFGDETMYNTRFRVEPEPHLHPYGLSELELRSDSRSPSEKPAYD